MNALGGLYRLLWTGKSEFCKCGHHIEMHDGNECMVQVCETREMRDNFLLGLKGIVHDSERGYVCSCNGFQSYDGKPPKPKKSTLGASMALYDSIWPKK